MSVGGRALVGLSVAALLLVAGVAAGEVRLPFTAEEFVVNSTTTGNQTVPLGVDLADFASNDPSGPAVGCDATGGFVVVWADENDGDGAGIFARGFDADGSERFAEMQVNVATVGLQQNPHVAVAGDGSFVVVWQSDPTGANPEIFARGFDGDGNGRFAELQVNTVTVDPDEHPRVAIRDSGAFVVVWDSGDSEGTPGTKNVHFRRFNGDGSPVDPVDRVANYWNRGNQRFPDVAFDEAGGFLIAWQSGAGGTGVFQDGDISGIFARQFDSSGNAVDVVNPGGQCFDVCATASPACTGDELLVGSKEICVNDHKLGTQDLPRVARNGDGATVIVWHSEGSNGAPPPGGSRTLDSSDFSVHGKRFDAAGNPVAAAWQVNSFTLSHQVFPDVAMAGDGSFLIAWTSAFQEVSPPSAQAQCAALDLLTVLSGACDALTEVYAEEYNPDGTVRHAELRVNSGFVNPAPMSPLDGIQVYPAIGVAADGSTVVAWSTGPPPSPFPGSGTDAQDGSGWGAMGRLAGNLGGALIFEDGFESGDTTAWIAVGATR